MPRLALVSAALGLVLLAAPPAHGAAWRWPVRGEVITPFAAVANPFAPGQHRGVDIAAGPGARVRAACGGRVRFAGPVPGRGRAVSVACGALVATHLELGSTSVRRGEPVGAGMPIGTVAASHVQLGARRIGRAHGYVDPLTLLAGDPPGPLGPAPPARRTRPRAAPRPMTPPAAPAPAPAPAAVPVAAWLGLAALAGATPIGAIAQRRRRRHRLATARAGAAG